MTKKKKLSKAYADNHTCYANDSHLQYMTTRRAYECGFEQAVKMALEWITYNNQNGGCLFDGWEENFKRYVR